ncbi:hypothetical protein Q5H91_10600 [Sphingomonas sp. KR1UV-12]|uniref:Inhibitor of lysozyme (Ivy) n=1 Tax=Sphingomonas aurea TaxID=3063994 RepID=A0ABT9EL45_9SPHN|nr:hypothetical protein [Sphingomonas sp. KR1UV-12]MDP1027664.1 hypothetical protein [Sphingomonas sp. KR1UV-12]
MAGLAILALAACNRDPDRSAQTNEVAASGFVPPVTQAPEPVAGQRNGTPLTAYVGHYPRDAVDGVSFYDRTEVANAMLDALPDEKIRREIVGRDVTSVPIFRQGSMIASHGCAPHNCAARNWTVLIAEDGNVEKAQVCVHDTATMNAASRWSTRRETVTRPGDCPQA